MANVAAAVVLALLSASSVSGDVSAVSPVQKVIELLQENKVKVQNDLDAEGVEMKAYSEFCDKESSEKGYAIKTATRNIADLEATITDAESQVVRLNDEVASLGTQTAEKESQLAEATAVRKKEKADFQASEGELVTAVDQLDRALTVLKREMAFLQTEGDKKKHTRSRDDDLKMAMSMISKVLEAGWVNAGTKKTLQGLIQTSLDEKDTDHSTDDLHLAGAVPAPTVKAYESSSGGIVGQIEDMKDKAEETLSNTRTGEMREQHNFDMMAQSLTDAITLLKDKTSEAKHQSATTREESGKAKAELSQTKKTKAADIAYLETLTRDCSEARDSWDERQKSASSEMAALDKAKDILANRVKVFMQFKAPTEMEKHWNEWHESEASTQDASDTKLRRKVVGMLKNLSSKYKSFALMELVSSAGTGPFDKIKGLIADMVMKLTTEANEEATQKSFCDEEMSKSRKVQDEKSMTIDKLTSRIDKAVTGKAELEQKVKELETEIAELDQGVATATKIRTDEHNTYLQASKDFKEAAEATQKAIGVLKEYYQGAFIQVNAASAQPSFGGSKTDAANSIISILEMCEENFTKLYMEAETDEQTRVAEFKKLSQETRVSKSSKQAEIKGSTSEIKSLEVALRNGNEDYEMTSKELDAVMAYLEKLKPQCETKVMSYAEKKQRREAEIEGLKEALSILDSEAPVFVQISQHLRATRRA